MNKNNFLFLTLIIFTIILFLFSVFSYINYKRCKESYPFPLIGEKFDKMDMKTAEGIKYELFEKDKYYLILLSDYCDICSKDYYFLLKLKKRFKDKVKLFMIILNEETKREEIINKYRRYSKYLVIPENREEIRKIYKKRLKSDYIILYFNKILRMKIGSFGIKEYKEFLKKIL